MCSLCSSTASPGGAMPAEGLGLEPRAGSSGRQGQEEARWGYVLHGGLRPRSQQDGGAGPASELGVWGW